MAVPSAGTPHRRSCRGQGGIAASPPSPPPLVSRLGTDPQLAGHPHEADALLEHRRSLPPHRLTPGPARSLQATTIGYLMLPARYRTRIARPAVAPCGAASSSRISGSSAVRPCAATGPGGGAHLGLECVAMLLYFSAVHLWDRGLSISAVPVRRAGDRPDSRSPPMAAIGSRRTGRST